MADENNSNEDGQFVPDGSMEPLSPQEADNTDYGLMVGERVQKEIRRLIHFAGAVLAGSHLNPL